jgi:hypothetical protein
MIGYYACSGEDISRIVVRICFFYYAMPDGYQIARFRNEVMNMLTNAR